MVAMTNLIEVYRATVDQLMAEGVPMGDAIRAALEQVYAPPATVPQPTDCTMTKTILSIQLTTMNSQTIKLPENAQIVRVGMVGNDLYVWYETLNEAPPIITNLWEIDIVKDGHVVPKSSEYIGTAEINLGEIQPPRILHLFISPISLGARAHVSANIKISR